MKALVVYDSVYSNTERVAEVIAAELGAELKHARVAPSPHQDYDVVVVGSPTQGGRPTAAVNEFLRRIDTDGLRQAGVAAFDTRFSPARHGVFLRLLMRVIGFAAGKISAQLQLKGGSLLAAPEGFIVTGKEGPLQDGEVQRAANWARDLAKALQPAAGSSE
jgi:flavodoxin